MIEGTRVIERIDYFKERVKYYFFNVFHLHDIELDLTEREKDEYARASSCWYPLKDGAQTVTIYYTKEWIQDKDVSFEEIDLTAFHEVCEVLLSELQQVCRARFIMEKDVIIASHRVIRRLENTVFNMIKDRMEENR